MIDYRFTPEAEEDLFEIWCYIARDSVAAANRVDPASRWHSVSAQKRNRPSD